MPNRQVPGQAVAGEPLLKTKLFMPRLRPDTVARPRLVGLVAAGLTRKLTLISAPAGSGKTTLLSEWRETETGQTTPVAWVSLEAADDLPHRFWLYVVQALDRLRPGSLTDLAQALGGPQPAPLDAVVTLLINQMAELEQETVLVLDDYHTITAAEIHRTVALLLEHMPPQFHLVITTRSDPPLPLHRLRVRRELAEVRLKELRFTPNEVAEFFGQAMGLQLTDRQVELLAGRTEGWIAGLQLAALSLSDMKDVDGFVDTFAAGSQQYAVDYLVEEVLQHQPEPVRRFLLQTSILGRLSGPLCDAVTGESNSQALLEWLERRNLFLIPLDHQRHWYRYHHLFAEALKESLIRERPDELPQLHRAASRWYEEQGLTEPAVGHAIAASDHDRAVQLVATLAEQIWLRGDSGMLMDWMKALPQALIRARPDLSFAIAWGCLTSGRPDLGESLLRTAEEELAGRGPEAAELLGKVLSGQAHIARVQRNFPVSLAYSRRALEVLPATSCDWRGWAVWNAGAIAHWSGDLDGALATYTEAKRLFQEADDLYGFLRATVWHAEILADAGRLPEALAEAEAALALAEAKAGAHLPVVSLAHLGVGEMLYEQYDLAGAERHLLRCLELGRAGGLLDVVWLAYMPLALVRQGMRQPDAALACLDLADQLAPRVPWALAASAVARAALLQRQGKTKEAAALAPQVERLARDQGGPFQRAALTLAQLKLGQGFPEEALALLTPLADKAGGRSVRLLALLALVLKATGQTERAFAVLERALTMALPSGQLAAFMELDRPMADLLGLFAPRWKGALADFASRAASAAPGLKPAARLVDPLSEREMEVLALLAEGAPNEAIAQRLVVTLHTAKKHVANILSKLGVANRTQAVARARELGLL
ncbi:MAG: ATP-dependent transcriptional regulator [Symbiobacteriaceae bacterium]|jgi:LuxR family maltose regulon positive regulatory protein|nr:ATP-dependent transcriptional regulator [Symbiobacteriaceae bacterium]